MPAEAGDHAVGGALVLDLDHGPLVLAVGAVEALGDDAVQAGAFEAVEPIGGHVPIARRGSQLHRRRRCAERLLQLCPARAERFAAQVGITQCQQVEGHERRRHLLAQHGDA